MTIELRTYASGDTDYIAKMNQNVAALANAINALEIQIGSIAGGSALSTGMFFDALFNRADAIIGPGSYKPTLSASTASIAPGAIYLADPQTVVTSFVGVPLNFVGQLAGTYYIVIDPGGTPTRQTEAALGGTVYSVSWSGSAFNGVPQRLCPIFFDTTEATASRISTNLGALESPPAAIEYFTLDERLEAIEQCALDARGIAEDAIEQLGVKGRKVGITVDNVTGVKGAIQVDFAGTIIGWSVIANTPGDLQVEVSLKNSAAPPANPAIPNTVTNKISASAPITLTAAQSASGGESAVSTWWTEVLQWDVIQFNVIATTIQRATLYVRIQEQLPELPVINPLMLRLPFPDLNVLKPSVEPTEDE